MLLAALLFASAAVAAQPSDSTSAPTPALASWVTRFPAISFDRVLIDVHGSVLPLEGTSQDQWVWDAGSGPPRIRLTTEVDPGVILEADSPSEAPFVRAGRFAAEVGEVSGDLPVRFGRKGLRGSPQPMFLSYRRSSSVETLFFLDASCVDAGVGIASSRGSGKPLFVAARCVDRGDTVDLKIFYSQDSWIRNIRLPTQRETGAGWVSFSLARPANQSSATLGSFEVSELDQMGASRSEVTMSPKSSRLSWDLGANTSYLSYSEPTRPISVTELGLTVKGGARYALIPGKFDLSASAFVTLVPLVGSSSPPGSPLARWYGQNTLATYKLEIFGGRAVLHLSLGWYFWGMIVPGSAYGVALAMGPVAFVGVGSPPSASRRYFAYLKYADFSPGFAQISPDHRELATGGSYQLGAIQGRWPISATLDIADIVTDSSDGDNRLSLFSVSIGASVLFP